MKETQSRPTALKRENVFWYPLCREPIIRFLRRTARDSGSGFIRAGTAGLAVILMEFAVYGNGGQSRKKALLSLLGVLVPFGLIFIILRTLPSLAGLAVLAAGAAYRGELRASGQSGKAAAILGIETALRILLCVVFYRFQFFFRSPNELTAGICLFFYLIPGAVSWLLAALAAKRGKIRK